jgi:hypothetical protein
VALKRTNLLCSGGGAGRAGDRIMPVDSIGYEERPQAEGTGASEFISFAHVRDYGDHAFRDWVQVMIVRRAHCVMYGITSPEILK